MNKIQACIIVSSILLSACLPLEPATSDDTAAINDPYTINDPSTSVETSLRPKRTSIFTYPLAVTEAQSEMGINGVLHWQDGCLYLKNGTNKVTPIFPESVTSWDEEQQVITLNGHKYRIGDTVSTNGGAGNYDPDKDNYFKHQGDSACLTDELLFLGTQIQVTDTK